MMGQLFFTTDVSHTFWTTGKDQSCKIFINQAVDHFESYALQYFCIIKSCDRCAYGSKKVPHQHNL